jgi:hypothetical protein
MQAGDTLVWSDNPQSINGNSYTATDYSLNYSLRGPSVLDVTAATDNDGWKTTITNVQSAILLPGQYRWAAYLTKTGERITAGTGDFKILDNIAGLTAGADVRSFYEKALAAAEQALADFSASGGKPKEYQIADKHFIFNDIKDILAIVNFFNAKVTGEDAAEKMAQGLGNPRRIFGRFG